MVPLRSRTRKRNARPAWRIEPGTTLPVIWIDRPGGVRRACDGVVASVALPKLVHTSAPASSSAAESATTIRIFRLRAGSTASADYGNRTPAGLRHPARMPLAGPRRQQQHQPRIGRGAHLAPLVGVEAGHVPGTAGLGRAAIGDLDLSVRHQQVCPLVHLVLLELLAGGK